MVFDKQNIKAILFDLDNTLIDFSTMKHKSCEAAIKGMISAGLKMRRDEALRILFKLYDKYGIEYRKIFQAFLKETQGKVDYRIIAHGIVEYRRVRSSYLLPYPNVVQTLSKLKKRYKLGIVTDAPRINAWLRLAGANIDRFFDVVITPGDVKRRKNSAIPYRSALRQLNLKPEEVLMVGDNLKNDIAQAKKLGMKTCIARYGINAHTPGRNTKVKADFEISDISKLSDILK